MSTRDKFLEDFFNISNRFSENICVYYALGLDDSLGISYFELHRASNELGRYFSNIFGNSPQYLGVSVSHYFFLPCIILAIWKSGNCFAGVGTQYTKKNSLDFLNFLRVKYLITDCDSNEYQGELIYEFSIHQQKFFVWRRQTMESECIYLKDICFGIMTSGSTGEPKIIQVPWTCILPNAVELSVAFQVTELDCIFQASPYSFDPFFIELLMTLLNGSSLLIVPNKIKLSSSDLLKTLFECTKKTTSEFSSLTHQMESETYFHIKVQKVIKKNITILQMTPSVFLRWTNREIQDFILSPKSHLRILILGGEKFPNKILKLKHPDNITRVYNIYGITEVSCWAFLNEVTTQLDSSPDAYISLGKPLTSINYEISKTGEFKIGSKDRICLVNKEIALKTKNPILRETGDIVKLLNEEIYFIGRCDQVVKKYGMKINLSTIENSYLIENTLIKECICLYDEESLKLALFYVPTEGLGDGLNFKFLTREEFHKNYKISFDKIKYIEQPDYFFETTEIPSNSHGKCDKKFLLKFFKDFQKPNQDEQNIEITFRKLWVEVLNLRNTNSFTSSFTELGGDSVSGLDLINKLEGEGFTVPLNFIGELLTGKNYENCLECLRLAQEKSEIPRKKIKYHTEDGGIGLIQMWKVNLGKCVDATPTIFLLEGEERLVIGSHSSQLSCINPGSGCEIWTNFLGHRIESGFRPTRDGRRGFIGCYDHYVYCIATSDGSVLWKFKTGDMVKSTPCLSTDEKTVYAASYDQNLFCLSALDGKLIKSLKLSSGGIFCSGIASDSLNSFFIGTLDGSCLCISQETNESTWKTSLASPIFASPCLIPGKPEVLFSEVLGNVHCLDALSGDKMWVFKAEGNIYSSPTAEKVNGANHIIFGCHDAHLYCLRYEKEPELKWKQQLDSSVFAKPLTVSEFSSVCAATTKGFICLCDSAVGSIKTLLKLDGEVFSSPIHRNNRLFVGCRDNNVYSLQITTPAEG